MNNTLPIYPLRYFYGRWRSDRDFILKRMRAIPAEKQQEIADRYEEIFLSDDPDSRKKANEFLHDVAAKYRDAARLKNK